jgi:hypothetical protein
VQAFDIKDAFRSLSDKENQMEQSNFFSRLDIFAGTVLDALLGKESPLTTAQTVEASSMVRQNRPARKEFYYYTRLIDNDTLQIVGHLTDISIGGFKLDSQAPIPVNQEFQFLMNLTSEVAAKPFMIFVARSRWCKVDPNDPYVYNVGYQLIRTPPEDLEIFKRLMEKYGRQSSNRVMDPRRSNKW